MLDIHNSCFSILNMCVTHEDLDKIREKIESEVEKFHHMVESHAKEEVGILDQMKDAVRSLATAQESFVLNQKILHESIDEKLKRIEPVGEGFSAARTFGKFILWVAGVVAGISLIIVEFGKIKAK